MTDITMQAFHDLIEKSYVVKAKKDTLEAELDVVSAELTELQGQILGYMDRLELTSHKTKWGNVVKVVKRSVQVPKDPDSKAMFFAYLEQKGVKDELLNINSNTLNSMFNAEYEAARAEAMANGQDFDGDDFTIPGLQPAKEYAKVTLRK